jgi:type VI secretion system protein ImpH
MAGEYRQETTPITAPQAVDWLQQLADKPYRFGFYTALRRLEAIYPGRPRLGYSARPRDDMVRIGQQASLAFAPSTLAAFERSETDAHRLQTYFFGMLGPNGALPLHLTEFAYERTQRHRDRTFARFLDLFHHRFATLFYRAWAEGQPTVQFDRPSQDRFGRYVGSLLGIGIDSLRNRDEMPDLTKLHFAGHMSCKTRHASGLQAILQSFLRVPVELEQFVGHWMELPSDCHLKLGGDRTAATLGSAAVLGRRIWDRRQTFRLTLGPLSQEDYVRLLPGGASLRRLEAVVKNYVGLTLRWEVRLVLRREEIPPLRLGRQGKLGWTSWLKPRNPKKHADDLVLHSDRRRAS